ncbi:nicotinate (nicotinamide) nucleotide adenylyltransferase [Desulforhopalus singaporensis]|uniref:Probable nicotinate-nucleotide adenylyltransferase n=1 Tax=Desulforhopalus singaporensis TaxID=91360 RepID=A0A1H0PG52_9BACT|nr:nicotinate (nicotinamide) nucleotide adenylyltransferase [Desulforhopalus singaporensis]SDP04037.1 nicotinate-nucleotide adenylyltransferase [Desulforhopalus singaporensis]
MMGAPGLKIGLFGGTFNPVHRGHMEVAETALAEAGLDRVLFIPSADPPHKSGDIAGFAHRVRMLEIACSSRNEFSCCTIEERLAKPSYTIDTLKEMIGDDRLGHSYYFVIGADAFLEIQSWKSYREILSYVHILLSKRVGVSELMLKKLLTSLGYTRHREVWQGARFKTVRILKKIPKGFSSSEIRAASKSLTITSELDPEVMAYIRKKGLYIPQREKNG